MEEITDPVCTCGHSLGDHEYGKRDPVGCPCGCLWGGFYDCCECECKEFA